jgi:hypothetical protein
VNSTITLGKAKQVTSEYASYARDASGLGNVVGALLVFMCAAVPGSALAHWWLRILLATTPFWWVVVKEQLRCRYYQQLGSVKPKTSIGERVYVIVGLSFAVILSAVSIAVLLLNVFTEHATHVTLLLVLSVLILAAIPFLVVRFMRGKYELITGLFLVFQSVAMLNTDSASVFLRGWLKLPALLVAIVMLFAGIDQHRQFLKLKKVLVPNGAKQS